MATAYRHSLSSSSELLEETYFKMGAKQVLVNGHGLRL
jgi:hypothetical protein